MHRDRGGRRFFPHVLVAVTTTCAASVGFARPPCAPVVCPPIVACPPAAPSAIGWSCAPGYGNVGFAGSGLAFGATGVGGWCGLGAVRSFTSVSVRGCAVGSSFGNGVCGTAWYGPPVGPWGWNDCGWYAGCGPWWRSGCGRGMVAAPGWCAAVPWCWPPIVVSPFGSWLPAGIAPVFGLPGVYPYLGLTSTGQRPPLSADRRPAGDRMLAGVTHPAARTMAAAGASNRAARQRAAKLVARGDEALRAAVDDRTRLSTAIDAYRRAAAAAPDLPDTRIRQALALAAAGRHDDAAAAIGHAVRIDRRLAQRPTRAPDGMPADPVFGDRPDAAPAMLRRGRAILAEVLAGGTGAAARPADGDNWIATAWSRRFGEPMMTVARR